MTFWQPALGSSTVVPHTVVPSERFDVEHYIPLFVPYWFIFMYAIFYVPAAAGGILLVGAFPGHFSVQFAQVEPDRRDLRWGPWRYD